jgi:hypothetical protein
VIETIARSLAQAYTFWGILFLLVPAVYGLHATFFILLLLRWRIRWLRDIALPGRRFLRLLAEINYGFINPLIYLALISALTFPSARMVDGWIDAASALTLAGIWLVRLVVPRTKESSPGARAWLSALCAIGIGCVMVVGLRDLFRAEWQFTNGTVSRAALGTAWVIAAVAPLYLIPIVLLADYRRRLLGHDAGMGLLLLSQRASTGVLACSAAMLLVPVSLAAYRPASAAVQSHVESLRPVIMTAADRYDVDPALLAAIVFVTQTEHLQPLRDEIERLSSQMLIADQGSHLGLARRFNVSIGVAQIKPVTALTAVRICSGFAPSAPSGAKDYRDTPVLGQEWKLSSDVCNSPEASGKQGVIAALLTDEGNLTFAAFILSLYERQWREANPAWDIGDRPEILATLYQIGFEKSRPHASPRSNAFGDRVAEVSREPWVRERFGPGAMKP